MRSGITELQGFTMYLSGGNTQVYSPFGSYVVEQHDNGIVDRHPRGDTVHEAINPALRMHQYCPIHAGDPTPTRLRILWNILLHKDSAKPN
jgi:hypothetical protein